MEEIQSIPVMENESVKKSNRGRKKIYTENEILERERARYRAYYHSHKSENKARHRKYIEGYKLYMKIINLINEHKIPDSVLRLFIEHHIINNDYFKIESSPIIKEMDIINGTAKSGTEQSNPKNN